MFSKYTLRSITHLTTCVVCKNYTFHYTLVYRVLLDQDSCQTQEELARTLGVTQPTISHRLTINAPFLIKNGRNLFVDLIVICDKKLKNFL